MNYSNTPKKYNFSTGGIFSQYIGKKLATSASLMLDLSHTDIFWDDIFIIKPLHDYEIDISLLKSRYELLTSFWSEQQKLMGDPTFEDNVLSTIDDTLQQIIVWLITSNKYCKVYNRNNMPERVINIFSLDPYKKPILESITGVILKTEQILPKTNKIVNTIWENPIWWNVDIDTSDILPNIKKELIMNAQTIFEIICEDWLLWEFNNIQYQWNHNNFSELHKEDIWPLLNYSIDILLHAIKHNNEKVYFHFIKRNLILARNPDYNWLK